MTEHPYAKLRAYDRCVAGMMADPDVTGDLLLIGLWLARATVLRDPPPGEGRWSVAAVAQDVFGPRHVDGYKVKYALTQDIRRYSPLAEQAPARDFVPCSAPMVRRAGSCGNRATQWGFVTDLATGRAVEIAACGRREHRAWYQATARANTADVKAAGDHIPRAAANAGGVLARHIRLNWAAFWRRLDPDWSPPAEGASSAKPRLSVLVNDDFEPAAKGARRPQLHGIDGGWR